MSGGRERRRMARAAGLGAACTLVLAGGLLLAPAEAVRATLVAAVLFIGLSLGAMLMLMVGALTGGAWIGAIRAPLTAMAAALPVGIVAMAVSVAGFDEILPWRAATDLPELVVRKLAYFDPAFLVGRSVAYAAAWIAILAFAVLPRGRPAPRAAVAALILYALSVNFFSTDWIMAPDPEFSSSVFPMIEAAGQATAAIAAAILVLHGPGRLARRVAADHDMRVGEDLGNLLFGLVLLSGYLAYMQWLVVWSGDLPPEIGWYIDRSAGIWMPVLVAMVLLHLTVPLVALPIRRVKRSPRGLAAVAACVLAGHALHVLWRIAPSYPAPRLLDAALLTAAAGAVGGLWIAAGTWFAVRRPGRLHEAAHA